jgi:hypothetical protein
MTRRNKLNKHWRGNRRVNSVSHTTARGWTIERVRSSHCSSRGRHRIRRAGERSQFQRSESGEFHNDTLVGESDGGRVSQSGGRLPPPPVADCDRDVAPRGQFGERSGMERLDHFQSYLERTAADRRRSFTPTQGRAKRKSGPRAPGKGRSIKVCAKIVVVTKKE